MSKLFVVGDIHGQYEKLVQLLRSKRLVNARLLWTGGDATLCFTGDFFDRGPNGIACIDLIMQLQRQAEIAGGRVVALLGNHELMLLAAHRFDHDFFDCMSTTFRELWSQNGGILADLENLNESHLAWLSALPVMEQIDDYLFMHSDSIRYAEYGDSIESVNYRVSTVLNSDLAWGWVQLVGAMGQRKDFVSNAEQGVLKAKAMLEQYGGKQIVHGHTPIPCVLNVPASRVGEAFVYADGLCINVDAGMYMGNEGFICELATRHLEENSEAGEGQYILQLPETYILQFPEPVHA